MQAYKKSVFFFMPQYTVDSCGCSDGHDKGIVHLIQGSCKFFRLYSGIGDTKSADFPYIFFYGLNVCTFV